ncbi:MAG: hypothetical protein WB729_21730 [Candidatus Sulfotelmatobacter sp.]
MPLVAIVVHPKHQMRDLLLLAPFHDLCHQRVGRPLVALAGLGEKRQNRCHVSPVDQFGQSDQFPVGVCADVVAAIEKRLLIFCHLLERLAVVGESFALADRRIVVQRHDVLNQRRIQFFHLDNHAALLRAPCVLARFLRQLLPPVFEGGQRNGGNAFPFDRVIVFRLRRGKFLRKGKYVCAKLRRSFGFERQQAKRGIFNFGFQPLFGFDARGSYPFSLDDNVFPLHFKRGNAKPLPFHGNLDRLLRPVPRIGLRAGLSRDLGRQIRVVLAEVSLSRFVC